MMTDSNDKGGGGGSWSELQAQFRRLERKSKTTKEPKELKEAAPISPDVANVRDLLLFDGKGKPLKNLANVMTILTLDARWKGVLAYDEFGERIVSRLPPPVRGQDAPSTHVAGEWSDEDSIRTSAWLATEYRLDMSTGIVDQAVAAVARRSCFHPVREYLTGLAWDGLPRLDLMLSEYFGTSDTPYTRGVASRWMISAVARVFQPGCQVDCMLVLESDVQGRGKSTGLEILASKEWFADTGIIIGALDSYQGLRRKWIYELGELASLKGRELDKVKQFLTARVDTYRPSYGRRTKDFPRQVVFAGTTNDDQYLTDSTGNRRFLPTKVERDVNFEGLRNDRDQLWAEATVRYLAGEKWHVDTLEFRQLAELEQSDRVEDDTWAQFIETWLEGPYVTSYDPNDGRVQTRRVDPAKGLLTADVLQGALRKKTGEITRGDEMRVGRVLRGMGFVTKKARFGVATKRVFFKVATEVATPEVSDSIVTSDVLPPLPPGSSHTHKNEGEAEGGRDSRGYVQTGLQVATVATQEESPMIPPGGGVATSFGRLPPSTIDGPPPVTIDPNDSRDSESSDDDFFTTEDL